MLLGTHARTVKQYFLLPALMLTVLFYFYLMAAAEAGVFHAYGHSVGTHFQHFLFGGSTM